MSQAPAHPDTTTFTCPALPWATSSGQPIANTVSNELRENFSDTLELTAAIASGNQEAFAVFYQTYFKFMFDEAARSRRIGGIADEAGTLDIVQDAMLRVIRSLRVPLESEAQLRAYLRRTVYAVSIDYLRSETRRKNRQQKVSTDETINDSEGSLANTGITQQLDWLNEQMAGLDDLQSNLMVMRYRFNWTFKKIGAALGLSAGAVDGRISRILSHLKKNALEDFTDD